MTGELRPCISAAESRPEGGGKLGKATTRY